MKEKGTNVSTEPYKGVRDFYPEDMAVQNYIFETWQNIARQFGYEEYGASILEPTELYTSKTNEEIVNEQTYTFTDRGDRSVTLRPEMTPSVARMVAGRRRELSLPIRWFSIPNCFRYERPQRGRTREFWQLNVDIFGVSGSEADVEIISIAAAIMKKFGAKDTDFEIRINSRHLLNNVPTEAVRLLDKKEKMDAVSFDNAWKEITGNVFTLFPESDEIKELRQLLAKRGVTNTVFTPTLARGFDYYTGSVFEVYDTNPKNPRALFGGGRYDNLLEVFGGEKLPAVGFGLGDVIMRDFLETHGLVPDSVSATTVMLCPLTAAHYETAEALASQLRTADINVTVYYGDKKIGDQIKSASKKKIPFVVCIGDEEQKTSQFRLKQLSDGEEFVGTAGELAERLR